jgi:hypothetical protein
MATIAEYSITCRCAPALRVFAKHLGIVLERELDIGKTLLHFVGDSGKIAAACVGRDIDPAAEIFAGDDVRDSA